MAFPFRYEPTPLPRPESEFVTHKLSFNPTFLSAYRLCHDEDARASATLPQPSGYLINIRILGWMFLLTPTIPMLVHLSKAVTSCDGDNGLYDKLGKFYFDYWIRMFYKYKSRAPTDSHPSRPSFDMTANEIRELIQAASRNYSKARKLALMRDGYRCLLTGIFNNAHVKTYPAVKALWEASDRRQRPQTMQCTHIFSESTNFDLDNGSKFEYAPNAWGVLKCFGYHEALKELKEPGIHRLENVLTLSVDIHDEFDQLELWFEPIDDDPASHRYRIGMSERNRAISSSYLPEEVEFQNQSTVPIPMPSKQYLRLHIACCKVATMSGAAEYLQDVDREGEDTCVLAYDSGSAGVLENIVWRAFYSSPITCAK